MQYDDLLLPRSLLHFLLLFMEYIANYLITTEFMPRIYQHLQLLLIISISNYRETKENTEEKPGPSQQYPSFCMAVAHTHTHCLYVSYCLFVQCYLLRITLTISLYHRRLQIMPSFLVSPHKTTVQQKVCTKSLFEITQCIIINIMTTI